MCVDRTAVLIGVFMIGVIHWDEPILDRIIPPQERGTARDVEFVRVVNPSPDVEIKADADFLSHCEVISSWTTSRKINLIGLARHDNQEKCEHGQKESAYVSKLKLRFAFGLILGVFFGPVLWYCGKLIVDDNRAVLGWFILGPYLALVGGAFLLIGLTRFPWSWGWWL